jgi:hypothetical protein
MSAAANRRLRPAHAVAALVLTLCIGLAAGRCTAPDAAIPRTTDAHASAPREAAADPGTKSTDTTNERGRAVAAATRAMVELATPAVATDDDTLRTTVDRLAAPAYRAELYRRLSGAFEAIRSGLPGGAGSLTVIRLSPLAYRIERWSGSTARVAVWQVTFIGASSGQVVASWSTSRADLARMDGRWWVTGFEADEPGPGPGATAAAAITAPDLFGARITDLEPYTR